MNKPATNKQYIEGYWTECPWCKSDDIGGGHIQVDGKTCWQNIMCNKCNKEWKDIYNLVGYKVEK